MKHFMIRTISYPKEICRCFGALNVPTVRWWTWCGWSFRRDLSSVIRVTISSPVFVPVICIKCVHSSSVFEVYASLIKVPYLCIAVHSLISSPSKITDWLRNACEQIRLGIYEAMYVLYRHQCVLLSLLNPKIYFPRECLKHTICHMLSIWWILQARNCLASAAAALKSSHMCNYGSNTDAHIHTRQLHHRIWAALSCTE